MIIVVAPAQRLQDIAQERHRADLGDLADAHDRHDPVAGNADAFFEDRRPVQMK